MFVVLRKVLIVLFNIKNNAPNIQFMYDHDFILVEKTYNNFVRYQP